MAQRVGLLEWLLLDLALPPLDANLKAVTKGGLRVRRLKPLPLKTPKGTIIPDWRQHTATVLVFLHDAHCHACRQVSQQYESVKELFAEWDAEVWLIWRSERVPESGNYAWEESGKARREWLLGDSAGVVVVDRHGVVVRQWDASEGKGFPPPEEVLVALKHLAVQCPECGVPDGDWASLAS